MTTQTHVRHPDKLFIDGRWVDASTSARFEVLNSATEELFLTVPEAREDDIEAAVRAARNAFDHGPWPQMSHAERAAVMHRIADEIDRRADLLARTWTTESGVLHSIARARMPMLTAEYRGVADLHQTFPFHERHESKSGGSVALLVREPVGVVAAIVPWNAPAATIASKVAPALLAGCTLIVKASPEAPGAAYILAEACEAAGLPPGVVNILTADRGVSELLVRHPGVDKIAFTGSTAAGRRIASLCGERIARCTLELGGKSPGLVLDDCDIPQVAKTICDRAMVLSGQVCVALTRIIVTRARHDALAEALGACFRAVRVGDPFDPQSQMGPLVSAQHRERVMGYIERGRADGARLLAGGGRPKHLERGFFVEPTLFTNVDNQSSIAREEIFGPVLSILVADDEEHAVSIANDTIYGLNASVFTHDAERAYHLARRIRSGQVGHNGVRSELTLCFGGFKQSGIGREGGSEGLRHYLESKVIVLDSLPPSLERTLG
jgi:aldehyde dehydrogenase (NAD+)